MAKELVVSMKDVENELKKIEKCAQAIVTELQKAHNLFVAYTKNIEQVNKRWQEPGAVLASRSGSSIENTSDTGVSRTVAGGTRVQAASGMGTVDQQKETGGNLDKEGAEKQTAEALELFDREKELDELRLTHKKDYIKKFKEAWIEGHGEMASYTTEFFEKADNDFQKLFSSVLSGQKSLNDAWKDLGDTIKGVIFDMVAEWIAAQIKMAAMKLVSFLFGIPLSDGGRVEGKAYGGYISGPGTSKSDSIPAMLSNGEYVLRASAVKRLGLPTLDALNNGKALRFADGGGIMLTPPALPSMKFAPSKEQRENMRQNMFSPVINISAVDARSVERLLRKNGGALVRSLGEQASVFNTGSLRPV